MRFKFVFSAEWPSLPQCLALCLNIIIHSFIHSFPCVISASPAPDDLQGFAGFCTLCQGAPIGVVTALWVAVWWCLLALLNSRTLLVVLSSPHAVLDLCGGCALFTACFPLP